MATVFDENGQKAFSFRGGGLRLPNPLPEALPLTPLGDPPPDLLGARQNDAKVLPWEILDPPLTCMLQYNASGIYYVFTVNGGTERAQSFGATRLKLTTDQSDPRKLWKSVDVLLGCGRVPASSAVDVEAFNQFFALRQQGRQRPPEHQRCAVADV